MEYILIALVAYQIYFNRKNFLSMAKTQAELAAQLTAATAKIDKIGTETRGLITKVQELTDIINNQAEVSPELQAAADAVDAQLTIVDELVPDATPETPPADENVTL